MKVLVVKTLTGSLKPAYDTDLDTFNKMPKEGIFEIEYKKKRNPKFHRKYFALINLAFNNQDVYETLEEVRHDIIVASGFYEEVVSRITGEAYKKAKSISFDSMDELTFSDLYEKTKDVISKWLGIANEDIENEIMQHF